MWAVRDVKVNVSARVQQPRPASVRRTPTGRRRGRPCNASYLTRFNLRGSNTHHTRSRFFCGDFGAVRLNSRLLEG